MLTRYFTNFYFFSLTLAFLGLALGSKAQQPLFSLLSAQETGINFNNAVSENEALNILSYEYFYNGGGVAVGDINSDGLADLFFTGNMRPNRLYLNLGACKFKDITDQAAPGLGGRKDGWKTGATMADVNGDGLLDIYVCYSGKKAEDVRRNQLFINLGNNKFQEEAKSYGLDDPGYSTQAAFLDYDNDGDLDMFLLNHNIKKIDNMEFASHKNEVDALAGNKLFQNDNGHFTDVSKTAGIVQSPLTFGLGIAVADINKDGWQDIYVTNDYNEPDYLYLNNKNGTFSDHSKQMLRHHSHFSMGVDIADFNNDTQPDIFTLDMLPADNHRQKSLQLQENYETFELLRQQELYPQYMRNMLHLNNGDGTFSEIGQLAGVSKTDWSWCPLIADFDNDGYKDIYISNGYLRDYTNKDFLRYWGDYKIKKAMAKEPFLLMDLVTAMPSTSVPDYIFKNERNLTFSNKQQEWGLNQTNMSNGAIYADLDNDGDLDLVVNTINQPASIYRNHSTDVHHTAYLGLKLQGTDKNTQAVGAKVFVYTPGQVQYQEVNPNRGYLSCVSTVLNFGLGANQKVDSVRVIWPNQTSQLLTAVKANQLLQLTGKPTGKPVAKAATATPKQVFKPSAPLFDFKPEEVALNDFKRQLLMLFMYSKTAPVMVKADVNKDGLDDLFVSGAKDEVGKLYLQQPGAKFVEAPLGRSTSLPMGTVAAAAFFDATGDGYPDLYVAKGGYSLYEAGQDDLQDEFYINDGKGHFTLSTTALPQLHASSKSCVRAADADNDGDIDIFVGGRVIPGRYPMPPTSYLLLNDGKGKFTAANVPFAQAGMVTDAQWVDLNKDGRKDLVLCGEMMPLTVWTNTPQGFKDQTSTYFSTPQTGFWFSLHVADVNADGQPDLVAGNLGLNSQLRATAQEPAALYYADFDNNGSIDPFLNFYVDGKSYPFVSRDELNDVIYPMRRRFTSYKAYADAVMTDIFSSDDLGKAGKLEATELRTTLFLNNKGTFTPTELPMEAQFSMVTQITSGDYNHDGHRDLLLLGNHTDNRLKLGSMDANYGCLLQGDGKGHFSYVKQPAAGICVLGDVKSVSEITVNKQPYLVVGVSNGPVQFYKE
ncbi:VCBS repeat-containing protein [Hymenobacter sp. BT559]|uniref:VCBS repeat-containing protein n=1 Tax=Hymenobacter sp. BT559 TaxID=2795729 RepID=UPI0018EB5F3F|nr:VCBS repeat-containing protein [Hymenobacter sp. BT559]MBJ6142272.1 VCBS repeat-containing protein [Hymenobacter sp. BT559]